MKHGGFTYILTNNYNTVLYTGITSNLSVRLIQHQSGIYDNAFTKRYHIKNWFTTKSTTGSKMQ
jgi:putative endonuclease